MHESDGKSGGRSTVRIFDPRDQSGWPKRISWDMVSNISSTYMNLLQIIFAILLCSTSLVLGQVEPAGSFTPPANPSRYVIIAEKTEATLRYDDAIRQAVFDLVYQGAGSEMADGSVFEIWIYGEETSTRGFLPEMLRPDNHLLVAQRASAYVRGIPSLGEGDMPEFAQHVRNLAAVAFETTIFLISSPETRLDGTTVDEEINEIFAVHATRMAQEGKPFITTFRVQDGVVANHSVSESALAMALPPMPPSRVSASEKEKMIADARAALKTAEEEKAKPEIEQLEPVAEKTEPKAIVRRIPDEEREGAIILRGNPKKKPVTTETAAEVAGIKEIVEPVDPEPNATTQEETVAAATPAVATSTQEQTPPADIPEVTENSPGAGDEVEVAEISSNLETPSTEEVAAGGVEGTVEMPAESVPAIPIVQDAGPRPDVDPKTFAVQPQTWLTAGGLLVAGLLFFVVAGLLIWIAIRRSRAAAGPSFITRSINDRKG